MNQRQILLNVDEFATKYELDDIRVQLRKGAIVAHSPEDFWLVEGLNSDDVMALSSEVLEERCWIYGPHDLIDSATLLAYYLGAIA